MGWHQNLRAGLEALDASEYADARIYFEAAEAADPETWETPFFLAWSHALEDSGGFWNRSEFAAAIEAALERGGEECADVLALAGSYSYLREDYEAAIHRLLKAIGRSPLYYGLLSEEMLVVHLGASLAGALNQLERQVEAGEEAKCEKTCESLEHEIRSAVLPSPSVRDELVAEVLATKVFCLQANGLNDEADATLAELIAIAPDHPRLPRIKDAEDSDAADAASKYGSSSFGHVGGYDLEDTFQGRLFGVFEATFREGDISKTKEKYRKFGRPPFKSYFLFGPSGCGKTYTVEAFRGEYLKAHGTQLAFRSLRLNEVMDKYVGESEKAITAFFDSALTSEPCVVFIDEIDALGASRDRSQSWHASLVGHFLQELDRIQKSDRLVVLFASSNSLSRVDMALLRRFDDRIFVEMPGDDVRERVLKVHLSKLDPSVRPEEPALKEWVETSRGLTSGDIEKAIHRAVDSHLQQHADSHEDLRLDGDLVHDALRESQNPVHVREWLTGTTRALRSADLGDLADEIEDQYRPFVSDAGERSSRTEATAKIGKIPDNAWMETPRYVIASFAPQRGARA